jgi:hypothetical protein
MNDLNRRSVCLLLCGSAVLRAEDDKDPPVIDLPARQRQRLLEIGRLHVDPLDGEGAAPIRDMLIGALQRAGLFVLTENPDNADAYLRGSAEDLIYTDLARYRAGLNVRVAGAASRREAGESTFGSSSVGVGDNEESWRRERKHEAAAAVRIVMSDGEVIWSATRESAGAKYRGASAEVAERIAEDLIEAWKSARAAK